MAVSTWLEIDTEDAQKRKATLRLRIKDSAFGTGVPAAAKLQAVVDAIYGFGANQPSNSIATRYRVCVEEDAPDTTGTGGSAISTSARVRNDVGGVDEFMFPVGGLAEDAVTFDPTNPNSIIVVGANWTAIRTALADTAVALENPTGVPISATLIAMSASVYDGRRSPPRPR